MRRPKADVKTTLELGHLGVDPWEEIPGLPPPPIHPPSAPACGGSCGAVVGFTRGRPCTLRPSARGCVLVSDRRWGWCCSGAFRRVFGGLRACDSPWALWETKRKWEIPFQEHGPLKNLRLEFAAFPLNQVAPSKCPLKTTQNRPSPKHSCGVFHWCWIL